MSEDVNEILDGDEDQHAAASEEDLRESVQTEQDARERQELLDDVVDIHAELEDLVDEAYRNGQTDLYAVLRDVVRVLRVSPFGALKEDQEEEQDDD